jgi:hypothetical protein
MSGKLESCALALQNLRLDVVRLRTGTDSARWQHITSVADQALAMAKEVDNAVYVADELSRLTAKPGAGRPEPGRT